MIKKQLTDNVNAELEKLKQHNMSTNNKHKISEKELDNLVRVKPFKFRF